MNHSNLHRIPSRQPKIGQRTLIPVVLLAISSWSAIVCGCTSGLYLQSTSGQILEFAWIGFCWAIPIGLAAWAVLRDRYWVERFSLPVVLLIAEAGAILIGQAWNSDEGQQRETSVVLVPLIFFISCLYFGVMRIVFRWRIGPAWNGNVPLRLWHLFLWTSIAAFAFAIVGLARSGSNEVINARAMVFAFLFALVIAMIGNGLATAALGLAMDAPQRRIKHATALSVNLLALTTFYVAWMSSTGNWRPVYGLTSLLVATVFPLWCFGVLRNCGYTLVRGGLRSTSASQTRSQSKSDRTTFMLCAIGCVILMLYSSCSVIGLAPARSNNARDAYWRQQGVMPHAFEGDQLTTVLFQGPMPLSNQVAEKLVDQPLQVIRIWDHTPELGSLRKLAVLDTLKTIQFKNSEITKRHLDELRTAKHLRDIHLINTPRLTPGDIKELQAALPGCTFTLTVQKLVERLKAMDE